MSQKVSDDEYNCQIQNMCDCYNIDLSCNEMTVLLFNFITDRTRHSTKYCHFFMTSILVKNSYSISNSIQKHSSLENEHRPSYIFTMTLIFHFAVLLAIIIFQ